MELDFEKKKKLIDFLWRYEFTDEIRRKMFSPHRRRLRTVTGYVEDGYEVTERTINGILKIMTIYFPELKSVKGQERVGLETRFDSFLRDPVLFNARAEHLRVNGGEVVEFSCHRTLK
jgi:hypothetical protein